MPKSGAYCYGSREATARTNLNNIIMIGLSIHSPLYWPAPPPALDDAIQADPRRPNG